MAVTYKLQMTFNTDSGSRTINLAYAKQSATAQQVSALMDAYVTAGSMFTPQINSKKAAAIVATNVTQLEVNS